MNNTRIAVLAVVVVVLSGYIVRISAGIEYAKETGKKCIYCHATTQPTASDLHWAGKYYAEKRTLKGYRPDAITAAAEIVEGPEEGSTEGAAPAEETFRELRRVYHTKCASCHGAGGEGAPGTDAPDFTDAAWQTSRSDAEIQQAIEKGRLPLMPLFAESLDGETIHGLAKLVRQFGVTKKGEEKEGQ